MIGKKAPSFNLSDQTSNKISLSSFMGKHIVLFFYPRDNTPGCTQEAIDFTNHLQQFTKLGTEVIGISRDTPDSHKKFIDKHGLKVTLLCDVDEEICKKYQVIKEKNMYGKKVLGIERSTFIIDDKGYLIKEWRKVKVANHAAEVLEFITTNLA